MSWQDTPKHPPDLLQTCKELCSVASASIAPKSIRTNKQSPEHALNQYDQDIVHIRDLDFNLEGHDYALYDEKRS